MVGGAGVVGGAGGMCVVEVHDLRGFPPPTPQVAMAVDRRSGVRGLANPATVMKINIHQKPQKVNRQTAT
jgi:hypothetical protein